MLPRKRLRHSLGRRGGARDREGGSGGGREVRREGRREEGGKEKKGERGRNIYTYS